jgi:hypothetical protein
MSSPCAPVLKMTACLIGGIGACAPKSSRSAPIGDVLSSILFHRNSDGTRIFDSRPNGFDVWPKAPLNEVNAAAGISLANCAASVPP